MIDVYCKVGLVKSNNTGIMVILSKRLQLLLTLTLVQMSFEITHLKQPDLCNLVLCDSSLHIDMMNIIS